MISHNSSFIEDIEKLCRTKNVEYIDAVIMWCEKHKVEVEYAAGVIKKDRSEEHTSELQSH